MGGQLPVNANATKEAIRVLSYLNSLMSPDAGLLTGQHNWLESPMGNINTLALPNSGGRYPAVVGLEVGAIEGQSAAKLYSQRAEVANTASSYWNNEGIPTIMWHCTYPLTPYQWAGGVQRPTTQEEFDQILTPGDPKFNWLIAEMDAIAVHFKKLYDAKVPILFRPWHEMNGYWFWWGNKTNLSTLWNLTYDRFVNHHGLDNILWVWNPNCMKATDPAISNYKLFYPGHDKVDVLAWDIYLGEFSQSFHDDLFAFGGGKPIALGEVGRLPDMNVMKASQWRYTWAMAWGEPNFSSENTTANKQQFYSHPYAITRDEVDIPHGGGGDAKFVKGINLNGGAVTIEGNAWLAESGAGITASGVLRYAGGTVFNPPVDASTSTMLNSDIYSRGSFSVVQALPNGSYQVYLWTAENYRTNFRSFHVKLEGKQVTSTPIGSMPQGEWRKYGPYTITVNDGTLNMELVRVDGDPSLSGMAIYTAGTPLPDTIPPSVPTNVTVSAKTSSSVSLTWSASTDNVGVTGYDVLLNGTIISATGSTSYTVTGLAPSTTYSFSVRAKDAAGNVSAASPPVSATTNSSGGGGTARFVKGINYNGGAVTVEGNTWLAESVAGINAPGVLRYAGATVFTPAVDAQTSTMLNSDIYARGTFSITQSLANGTYQIYLWTAENYRTNFRSFHVKLEGNQVTTSPIGLMPLGQWRKYGPYTAMVNDGALNMDVVRVTGDPSLSGMAIYKIN
jgi:chitodextrinase